MNSRLGLMTGLIALALPTLAFAQQPAATPRTALIGELVLEMGGDRVAETFFTNGESQTMRAGQGGTGALGLELRPVATLPLSVRATAGIKFVTTAADNVDIHLTRIPVELVASYGFANDVRIGAGVVRHMNVKFDGGGLAPDADLDSSTGFTAEVGWRWVALTWTKLDYTDEFGGEYDAGSIGISVSAALLRF